MRLFQWDRRFVGVGLRTALAMVCLTVSIQSARAQSAPAPPPSKLAPAAGPTPQEMAACLRLIGAERFDEARAMTQKLVNSYPKSSRAHLFAALAYHKDRRYQSAVPLFERALALDPKDHVVRTFYGWCLYNLGKTDDARTMFNEFLRIQPDYADAHFAIGLLDFEADKIDAAAERFRKAIECAQKAGSRSDEAKARARLADIHIRTDKLQLAKQELKRAVQLNPDLYGAHFKLSRVLQRLGDRDGAARARVMHERVRERVRPTKGHPE